jgi:hypothetical protein
MRRTSGTFRACGLGLAGAAVLAASYAGCKPVPPGGGTPPTTPRVVPRDSGIDVDVDLVVCVQEPCGLPVDPPGIVVNVRNAEHNYSDSATGGTLRMKVVPGVYDVYVGTTEVSSECESRTNVRVEERAFVSLHVRCVTRQTLPDRTTTTGSPITTAVPTTAGPATTN